MKVLVISCILIVSLFIPLHISFTFLFKVNLLSTSKTIFNFQLTWFEAGE